MQAEERGGCAGTSDTEHRTSNIEWAGRALDVAILLLAAALRLAWLGVKPAHFDEGVNGWFVDGMTATGFYHYEPTNFHGPLHFYVLFVAQTLLGRSIEVLRLPLALVSIAVVAFPLFGWRRFFTASVCRLAALGVAVSPAMVFYGRYAIHETWLVLFQMLAAWGILGLWRDGQRRDLWALGLGITGMILTKETWIVHATALALAALVLIASKWNFSDLAARIRSARGAGALRSTAVPAVGSGGTPEPSTRRDAAPDRQGACSSRNFCASQIWTWRDLMSVSAVCLALLLFFYSGCLLDPTGLFGLVQTYEAWIGTGTDADGGHAKPWFYWLQLLANSEWPALLGVVASLGLLLPRCDRTARFLAIAGGATLLAYSVIAYKTPWCVVAIVWPFFFVFGAAVRKAAAAIHAWSIGALASGVLGCSLVQCAQLNFARYAPSPEQDDYAEPYVYVQTRREIAAVLDPLRWLAARDPMAAHRRGHVLQPEHHPLLWLLGDYTHLTWGDAEGAPEQMDADWLLVDEIAVDRVEMELRAEYFKTSLQLRGMAPDRSVLYLRASTFRDYFSGREPEFVPTQSEQP